MVVADFRPEADPEVVGPKALALRTQHRDATTNAYVVGAPVLQTLAPGALRPVAGLAVLFGAAAIIVLLAAFGTRRGGALLVAMLLACGWAAAGLMLAGTVTMPWTALALVPTALVAAVGTAAQGRTMIRLVPLGVALAIGFLALGGVAGEPAASYALAGAVGVVSAIAAAGIARVLIGHRREGFRYSPWLRFGAMAAVVVALAGVPQLRSSFSLAGYGERYVPGGGAADLRAVRRLFPPPTALALRIRGTPGFVKSPAVLQALDGLGEAARADPAVVRALSLADIVKTINRAFHENRAEFHTLPEDRGLIGRYLVLGYSPGFRQFTDRAFGRSALWVYLDSDDPRDLARVAGRLRDQLQRAPVPDAEVDFVGGDGAVILAAREVARRLAFGGVVFLLVAGTGLALLSGWRTAVRGVTVAAAAAAVTAGTLGWTGVPIDLLSAACLLSVLPVGFTCGAVSDDAGAAPVAGLALVVGALAVPALAAPFGAAKVLGATLLGAGVGCALARARPRQFPDPAAASVSPG
jgi:hypothetical protein